MKITIPHGEWKGKVDRCGYRQITLATCQFVVLFRCIQVTEMELQNLALARAAECQMLQQQQHRHSGPVLPAFYPPNPSAVRLSYAVDPDRHVAAPLPAPSVSLPVYNSVAPAPPNFDSRTVENAANPDEKVGGQFLPVSDSKTRPTRTGSEATTPIKRHSNSFSIDSLLGRQQVVQEKALERREFHKAIADRGVGEFDGGPLLRPALHRTDVCLTNSIAPAVSRTIPVCTAGPKLVSWF